MPAPTIPNEYVDIDWTQRAQILNSVGTLINSFITYWSSDITPVSVPDAGSGGVYLTPSAAIAEYVTALNGVNTEFTLGVDALAVPSTNLDINAFVSAVNNILVYLAALLVKKP